MSELTPEDVREILRLVEQSRFDEFELETPRFTVRFRRDPVARETAAAGSVPGQTPEGGAAWTSGSAPEKGHTAGEGRGRNGLVEVCSPMVGTFYRAPSPGAPPFVEVGTQVVRDTQVCIIEVMKLMSSIAAGVDGTVAEICRRDAEPVEYGDVLLRIRPE